MTGTSTFPHIFVSHFYFLIREMPVHVPYPLSTLVFSVFLIKVGTL